MSNVVYEEFLTQVRRDPDAVAIVDQHGETTYSQLEAMAGAVARQIPAGASFVGVVMDHGAEMIAAMLAALKVGAAYVPAEPDFPVKRIGFMLGECKADVVVTQQAHEGVVRQATSCPLVLVEPGALRGVGAAGALGDANATREAEGACAACQAKPQDLAYVLYTSGTTGTPKGVSVENRNVCSYVRAFHDEFGNGPGDRMLQHSVCSFDIFTEEVFGTLLTGGTLVIPPRAVRNDTAALIDFIDANGITLVDGFPYLMDDINSSPRLPQTVRLYISGGDVLHESQVSRLVDWAEVYNTYGPSETTCCVSYFRCDGAQPSDDGTYPAGHAVMGTRIDVVDDDLRPVPDGQVGELLITGPGVSRGYLGGVARHPEQANFVETPAWIVAHGGGEKAGRSYRSGDMGYRRGDGNLVFLHRKDSQVMIGGKRVEAKEVENVLLQDDAVHQAVVVPESDEDGFSYLIAYVVPQKPTFSLADLEARLRQRLTPFMIPEFFVRMKAIPLNDHGKPAVDQLPVVLKHVQRSRLQEKVAKGA